MKLAVFLIAALACTPARAQDLFAENVIDRRPYAVQGNSLGALLREMATRGPRGYWAYTATFWTWDAQCTMRFRAEIDFPELTDRSGLPEAALKTWDDMIAALWAHEMEHVEIGRAWAAAIKQADCEETAVAAINRAHENRDAELDARTDHGRLTGVTLEPPGQANDRIPGQGGTDVDRAPSGGGATLAD